MCPDFLVNNTICSSFSLGPYMYENFILGNLILICLLFFNREDAEIVRVLELNADQLKYWQNFKTSLKRIEYYTKQQEQILSSLSQPSLIPPLSVWGLDQEIVALRPWLDAKNSLIEWVDRLVLRPSDSSFLSALSSLIFISLFISLFINNI